jgi:hypothetical protein
VSEGRIESDQKHSQRKKRDEKKESDEREENLAHRIGPE